MAPLHPIQTHPVVLHWPSCLLMDEDVFAEPRVVECCGDGGSQLKLQSAFFCLHPFNQHQLLQEPVRQPSFRLIYG